MNNNIYSISNIMNKNMSKKNFHLIVKQNLKNKMIYLTKKNVYSYSFHTIPNSLAKL